MKAMLRMRSVLGAAALSVGALAALAPLAWAKHDVYPPGWNEPAQSLPPASVEFRAGCGWDDYQRYWLDQTGCGSPKSHPMTNAPIIYQMNPQGERYHRVN